MSQSPTDTPLVVCDQASVTLAGRPALSEVSFRLCRGQTWLVLGRNGSGKSTLLRLLRGDIWPDDDGRGSRSFFPENGPARPSPLGLRHRLGLVSPELALSFKRLGGHLSVAECILAGARDSLYFQGSPSPEETARLDGLLARLELTALAALPVAALSNGQLRAVLLARSLAREPLALFLDEFLDGLDSEATALAGRIATAAAAGGTAVVITSHRPAALPLALAQGMVLDRGRITETGEAGTVLAGYAASLPEAPVRTAARTQAEPGARSDETGPPLVVIENATVMLSGFPALREVSLTIRPGIHMALVGANGSGKTTLFKLIAGEHHPAVGGRVDRPGLAAPEGLTDLREIRKRLGLVSFELEAAYDREMTGREVVLSGPAASVGLHAEPTLGDVAEAMAWMERLGIDDLAECTLGRLSAGQTRRLFLARAMVARPRLLLLDEPFAGLDAPSRRVAMDAVSTLAMSGTTVVTAVHRPGDIIPEIEVIRRLDQGRLVPESSRG
jgi:molybdate transport system ATP-binding protein